MINADIYESLLSYSDAVFNQNIPDYKRCLFERISANNKMTGVVGPKGVGKTTILLQAALNSNISSEKILYVSCDTFQMTNIPLYDLAQHFSSLGGKLLIIDEIHYANDYCRQLKTIHSGINDLAIFYSGSSAIKIADCSSADISRRTVEHYLPPMSLREYIEMRHQIKLEVYSIDTIINQKRTILNYYKSHKIKPFEELIKYTINGGYPFFTEKHKQEDFLISLNNVITNTVNNELDASMSIDTKKKIKIMLRDICKNKELLYKPSEIATTYWGNVTSRNSVPAIINKLTRAGLLLRIEKDLSIKGRFAATADKLVIAHPNLSFAICSKFALAQKEELFFLSQLANAKMEIKYDKKNIYTIDDSFSFVIGINEDNNDSIYSVTYSEQSYSEKEIPLWLFGLLY